jgi:hypothetical protein
MSVYPCNTSLPSLNSLYPLAYISKFDRQYSGVLETGADLDGAGEYEVAKVIQESPSAGRP